MNVQCHHICFKYPGTEQLVLDDLVVDFKGPGLHALFGPSGVGKSSLAQIISGRLQAQKGRVGIDECSCPPLYAHNLERLPGWSSIGCHLQRVTPEHHEDQKDKLIDVFELRPLLNHRFDQLSLGQQNRVNLVRYLVQDAGVLLMDETLSNVDEKMRGQILMTIKEMLPERLFIYISHNVVEVATFCRDIWVLRAPPKLPQAVVVHGQDRRHDSPAEHHCLQKIMLEIMNAA
jgi:ABC-type nitrate/sulfonate/bicarbonate transport system ATPase subunit